MSPPRISGGTCLLSLLANLLSLPAHHHQIRILFFFLMKLITLLTVLLLEYQQQRSCFLSEKDPEPHARGVFFQQPRQLSSSKEESHPPEPPGDKQHPELPPLLAGKHAPLPRKEVSAGPTPAQLQDEQAARCPLLWHYVPQRISCTRGAHCVGNCADSRARKHKSDRHGYARFLGALHRPAALKRCPFTWGTSGTGLRLPPSVTPPRSRLGAGAPLPPQRWHGRTCCGSRWPPAVRRQGSNATTVPRPDF